MLDSILQSRYGNKNGEVTSGAEQSELKKPLETNLQMTIGKQILNKRTVNSVHTGMMDCKTIWHQILQIRIRNLKTKVKNPMLQNEQLKKVMILRIKSEKMQR